MFFDDFFGDLFGDLTIPVILALDSEEDEERDFFDMSDEEIRSYYENDKLGKL